MKLVEIKDVRVGQIWTNLSSNFTIYIIDMIVYENQVVRCKVILDNEIIDECSINIKEIPSENELIGFLNITHKLENNKLVEIRKEFEVDDIIIQSIHIDVGCSTDSGVGCYMNDYREIIAVDKYEYLDFNGKYIPELSGVDVLNKNYKGDGFFTKIGILGITHEFVNDKLIIKE